MLDELHKLNETWNRAWHERDAATVDRIMTEDYVYVAPDGRILDRQTILSVIRSPTYSIHHGANTEIVVRPLGADAALIRRRWQGEVTFEGTLYKEDHRVAMICARTGGQWHVVFEQAAANQQDVR